MKGGYQILDLTGATAGSPVVVKGIYKAAAGNNGKPVMILTNDGQRVYAEIAEDDGDFITCYISAEGKTVNITIKSDDSITTVISDPGASITGLEQAVNEIAGNIGDVDDLTTTSKEVVGAVNELNSKIGANDIGQYVDIKGYTSDKYTFPSDGYVRVVQTAASPSSLIQGIIYGSGSRETSFSVLNLENAFEMFFVKKGMKINFSTLPSAGAVCRFIPIE